MGIKINYYRGAERSKTDVWRRKYGGLKKKQEPSLNHTEEVGQKNHEYSAYKE